MTTPPLDLGISIDARTAFVELLLAVARVNDSGRRLPCQTSPACWSSDARLSDRNAAIEACGHCPIQQTCARYADAAAEKWHVWGGRDRARRTKESTE